MQNLEIGPLGSDKTFKNLPFSFGWHQGCGKKCKICSDGHIRPQIIQICSDCVIRPQNRTICSDGRHQPPGALL